jgi:hypothetical protein
MPLPYCTPEDIARKIDQPPGRIDADERTRFSTRARAASQRWDRETGSPARQIRVGATDRKATWETHDSPSRSGFPLVISLNNGDIQPLNASVGDALEVRTGRDSYEDVTSEEGDEWVLDNRRGQLKLFRFLVRRLHFEGPDERLVRLTYRHGALGGSRDEGAATTLSSSVTSVDTTLSTSDPSAFPATPFVAGLGTSAGFEHVRVEEIDSGAGTVTVTRGVQQTEADSHPEGAILQYVPPSVREAVAARAAVPVVLDDDARTAVPDDGQLTSRTDRADELREQYRDAARSNSDVLTL